MKEMTRTEREATCSCIVREYGWLAGWLGVREGRAGRGGWRAVIESRSDSGGITEVTGRLRWAGERQSDHVRAGRRVNRCRLHYFPGFAGRASLPPACASP